MAGSMLTGFQALLFVIAWLGVVLIYGLYRSTVQPDPDPLRPAGPIRGR